MTAQIRPNRMEVSDRFPMVGFAIKSDAPWRREPRSFSRATSTCSSPRTGRCARPRTSIRAANMDCCKSRTVKASLPCPRGARARFIGQGPAVFRPRDGQGRQSAVSSSSALPRDGSPYVSLRSFQRPHAAPQFRRARRAAPRRCSTGPATIARPGGEPVPGSPAAGNGWHARDAGPQSAPRRLPPITTTASARCPKSRRAKRAPSPAASMPRRI